MGRLLAIDYGLTRTGVAVTDEMQMVASPLTTVQTCNLLDWMRDYIANNNVVSIVVGYPLKTKNSDNSIIEHVNAFIGQCQSFLPPHIAIDTFDERYTSTIAHQTVCSANVPKNKRRDKSVYDKIAACVLLQDYLQYIKTQPKGSC